MKTKEELIRTWQRSVSVMHIAHHLAAARFHNLHLFLGAAATFFSALVGASAFASLTKMAQGAGVEFVIALASITIFSTALTGTTVFLKLDDRAARHTRAAADFQALRREMEQELVRLAEEKSKSKSKSKSNSKSPDNYRSLAARWHEVLKGSPPLPQSLHDRAKRDIDAKHKE